MSEKIVQLNEEVIKGQIKELVRIQAACAFFRGAAFQKQETGNICIVGLWQADTICATFASTGGI